MGRRKLSDKNDDKIARLVFMISDDYKEFDVLDAKGKEIKKYKNIKIPQNIEGPNKIDYIVEKVKETIQEESTNFDFKALDFQILEEENADIDNNLNELTRFICWI